MLLKGNRKSLGSPRPQSDHTVSKVNRVCKNYVIFQEDIEEEDLVMATTEEAMADMKIEEIETNQAATLILADAIEEIQTGDLLLKMISERPPQVIRKKIQIDKCVMRR